MAYVGRPPSNSPLTSADIPDGIVTAADLAPDSVGTSELADSVTLVTPNLGTPSAGVVTNLSGVLPVGVTGGSGLSALSATNLTSGTLPKARLPVGSIVQIKFVDYGSVGPITAETWTPDESTGVTFDTPMLASSHDVMIMCSCGMSRNSGGDVTSHINVAVGGVSGGGAGLSADGSGQAVGSGMLYYNATVTHREFAATCILDTGCTSTTPDYHIYFGPQASVNATAIDIHFTMIEIVA